MLPTSTYRLQFRNGFGFDQAIAVLPYLASLGISHVYASPIFAATAASTHGYDVTDHNQIDPAIGGRKGFERFSAGLKQHGLGLILDIVPNHMAASLENPWWHSVIRLGQDSPYARHFDIDWRERLTLPNLGKPFDQALADGEIRLARDPRMGEPALAYFDNLYPLHPDTLDLVRKKAGGISAAALERLSGDRAFLQALHQRQPYQLTFWKEARRHLSYRRFFEVTGLVGVRVEDADVFADVHRLILELVRSGQVDGLRVDHVDGLADPKAYLEQLRAAAGPETYLVVEKILNGEERLASDWPIHGTTGYEFTAALGNLLVDGNKVGGLARAYADVRGAEPDLEAERRAAKRVMVSENFETELKGLVALAEAAGVSEIDEAVRDALVAVVTAFPVYRTYIDAAGVRAEDQALLRKVEADAKAFGKADDRAIEAVLALLTSGAPEAAEFRARFQQLTGPVTAKSVEDTLFYRFNQLIALNEVGCDPAEPVGSVERFHQTMAARVSEQPHGMLGTSTHDTKRGEDARARLYALSEAPEAWTKAVERWRGMHQGLVQTLDDGPAPEPDLEWLLLQALAGIWEDDTSPATLDALKVRFLPYVEKVLREAKLRTDWTSVNETYETAVKAYVERLFSPENRAFQDDFAATVAPFAAAGRINSLTQTLIKLTAPGIPDIYRGSEGEDLSLVDPDNRRPVDYAALKRSLAAEESEWLSAIQSRTAKQRLIRIVLALRREDPALFAEGEYQPLTVSGAKANNAVGFLRSHGGKHLIVVVPRLPLGLFGEAGLDPDAWQDTRLELPPQLAQRPLRDRLNNREVGAAASHRLVDLLSACPVALLTVD